ncbi:DUF2834 domain-containing protein [Crocosphaera watsonii WH 8501]|uniref:DUF2834 domain-containing protein n=1 Tax=Crocosphaera watsonii WH 8501 TaxID=165597 RepID=Q4C6S1_CROWT|nr:hypothetical protein [Crocosphaera watsonii]EAM51897.1 conserved hypothetical protein [Crocosphaera watsonii WH 8501]
MISKIFMSLLWVGFLIYGFLLAPPGQPDTIELIQNLSTGNWDNINPLIISVFNSIGLVTVLYANLLFIDGREQKIVAWPFAITGLALGTFAILPYFILREPNPKFSGEKNLFIKLSDSRFLHLLLTITLLVFVFWGAISGSWVDFVSEWQSRRFINVMSLDLLCLCLIFPLIIRDDMLRRNIDSNTLFWVISLIPLLGTLVYLCFRPSLPQSETN